MSTLWWAAAARRREPSLCRPKVVIWRLNRLGAGSEKRLMIAQSSWMRAARRAGPGRR